jgi:hypothetical protein
MPEQIWNKRVEKQVQKDKHELFERTVLPYLNSAYNLARWLTRNEHDAEDIVVELWARRCACAFVGEKENAKGNRLLAKEVILKLADPLSEKSP